MGTDHAAVQAKNYAPAEEIKINKNIIYFFYRLDVFFAPLRRDIIFEQQLCSSIELI